MQYLEGALLLALLLGLLQAASLDLLQALPVLLLRLPGMLGRLRQWPDRDHLARLQLDGFSWAKKSVRRFYVMNAHVRIKGEER